MHGKHFFIQFCLYRAGPRPHIPFPPDLILYVNLVAKGAPKFFKTLAPRLTVLGFYREERLGERTIAAAFD